MSERPRSPGDPADLVTLPPEAAGPADLSTLPVDAVGGAVPPQLRQRVAAVWSGTLVGHESPGATLKAPLELLAAADPPSAASSPPIAAPTATLPDPAHLRASTVTYPSELGLANPTDGVAGRAAGIAEYEVLRVIGKGGMGVVYAARQTSLARPVALKMVLEAHATNPGAVRRFLHEALVTGDLDHPNIVPVHDLARDPRGNLYLAMKMVRGVPWDDLLHAEKAKPEVAARAGRMGLRDHLEILLRTADAVAYAHSRGIVHRDLKPENVMVGDFGEVLLMDWGIALDVSESPSGKAEHRSQSRAPAGTPRYMSPELALGRGEQIGPATDVYLLGGILYEILTGEPPHRGGGVQQVLLAAALGSIELPELRAPQRTIPRELSRVALRALAREPGDRYADVPAFQAALRDFMAHEESLRLAEEGDAHLDRLALPAGSAGSVSREERYAAYTEALGAFGQALHLWADNERALGGQARAAADHADLALERGDVGLAATQLAILEKNAHAEPGRLRALQAAVAQRSTGRWRRIASALAVVAVLLAQGILGEQWQKRREADSRRSDLQRAMATEVERAWQEVDAGNRPALSEANHRLARTELQAIPGRDRRLEALLWAEQVLLWSQGRTAELLENLLRTPGLRVRAEAARQLLLDDPMVQRTRLGRMVEPLKSAAEEPGPSLWAMLARAARQGLPDASVQRAIEILEQQTLDPVPAQLAPPFLQQHGQRLAARRLLRRDALRSLSGQRPALPFLLRQVATSADREASTPVPPPVLLLGTGRDLVGLDRTTGEELFRHPPMAPRDQQGAVPLEDGSVVVAAGRWIAHLDGRTGRVRQRRPLPGPVMLVWPDPQQAGRLAVLALVDRPGTGLEQLHFKGPDLRPDFALMPGAEPHGLPITATVLDQRATEAARERAAASARAAGAAPPPRLPNARAPLATLEQAMALDVDNLGLLLRAVTEAARLLAATGGETLSGTERASLGERQHRWAERAAQQVEDDAPVNAALVASTLERAGLGDQASAVLDRSARRFLERGGNADLGVALAFSPTIYLRRLGGELFARGQVPRALDLVERARRFSTYAEADHRFYRRYVSWLELKGRHAEAAQMRQRVQESVRAGGTFLLPSGFILGLDLLIYLLLLAPLLLLVLVGRAVRQARATQRSDLYARGMRTWVQRTLALVLYPASRLGATFLAYAPRSFRLALALTSLAFLLSAAMVAGSVQVIAAVAQVPLHVSNGHPGNAGLIAFLEERLGEERTRAAARRVLAEGYFVRGLHDRARELLVQLEKDHAGRDGLAANNLGVLAELAGQREAALERYRQAARPPVTDAAAAAVARYNLARLTGTPAERAAQVGALAHRDRLHAELHSQQATAPPPLWAHSAFQHLQDVLLGYHSPWQRGWEAFVDVLTGKFGALVALVFQGHTPPGLQILVFIMNTVGYAAVAMLLLTLIWMPLPVRQLAPPADPPRQARWRSLASALVGGAWPGLRDLVRGHALPGALMTLLCPMLLITHSVVVSGGLVRNMSRGDYSTGYFLEVREVLGYPELTWLGFISLGLLLILYGVNAARELRLLMQRWRGRAAEPAAADQASAT